MVNGSITCKGSVPTLSDTASLSCLALDLLFFQVIPVCGKLIDYTKIKKHVFSVCLLDLPLISSGQINSVS